MRLHKTIYKWSCYKRSRNSWPDLSPLLTYHPLYLDYQLFQGQYSGLPWDHSLLWIFQVSQSISDDWWQSPERHLRHVQMPDPSCRAELLQPQRRIHLHKRQDFFRFLQTIPCHQAGFYRQWKGPACLHMPARNGRLVAWIFSRDSFRLTSTICNASIHYPIYKSSWVPLKQAHEMTI